MQKLKIYTTHREWTDEDNRLHRTDGPAVEWTDGNKEYWFYGTQVAVRIFLRWCYLYT